MCRGGQSLGVAASNRAADRRRVSAYAFPDLLYVACKECEAMSKGNAALGTAVPRSGTPPDTLGRMPDRRFPREGASSRERAEPV